MPKPTFHNLPEDKRQRFVEAALDEFAGSSYEAASVSRIVQTVGIAKGSFYQYFENKLDLYLWLLQQAAQRKLGYIEGSPQPEPGRFFDWLERSVLAAVRFGRAEPRVLRMSLSAMEPTSVPELRQLHASFRRQGRVMFTAWIEEAQRHGEVRKDADPALAAHLLINVLGMGLMDMLCDAAGTDFVGMLTSDAFTRLTDDDVLRIGKSAVELLRSGLGAARE